MMLRLCAPHDREDFMSLERDPEVMRYLNGGHAVDQQDSDPNSSFLMPRGTEAEVWTARRTENEAFVGWFCLFPDNEKVAELGYRLARNAWGQGLATEGAAALVEWGFGNGGFETIFASAAEANQGSCRVLEKLGFQRAGVGDDEGEVRFEKMRDF
jgi:RimJ/RimL family protein N-acetyltransferase